MAAGMRVNRAPPTAASAGCNMMARAWRTTRAPILMRRVRRPVGRLLRQIGALQEDTRIAGRCMKLKPHLVPRHALAGKTSPIDCLPACLDMPFGGAALVVEPNGPVRLHRRVGDHEADLWEAYLREQVTRMPFDPGDDPPWFVP